MRSQAVAYKKLKTMQSYKTVSPKCGRGHTWRFERIQFWQLRRYKYKLRKFTVPIPPSIRRAFLSTLK